jgi:hypothetical protein
VPIPGGLTGNYIEDTQAVVKSLRYTVNLPKDAPERPAAQAEARAKIGAYAARYHLNTESTTLSSIRLCVLLLMHLRVTTTVVRDGAYLKKYAIAY